MRTTSIKMIRTVIDLKNSRQSVRRRILGFCITKYPLLHKIGNIHINLATKKMLFKINGKYRDASTTNEGWLKVIQAVLRFVHFDSFNIHKDTFDYCMKTNNLQLDED